MSDYQPAYRPSHASAKFVEAHDMPRDATHLIVEHVEGEISEGDIACLSFRDYPVIEANKAKTYDSESRYKDCVGVAIDGYHADEFHQHHVQSIIFCKNDVI